MADFYFIWTDVGLAMLTAYATGGPAIDFTTLVLGDGLAGAYYNPTSDQTALKHQVWSGPINSVTPDPNDNHRYTVEGIVPPDQGPFTVREVGIKEAGGQLVLIGKYPLTEKPSLPNGSGKDLSIIFQVQVANAGAVTLMVDPSAVLATRSYIDSALLEAGYGAPVTLAVETTLTAAHGTVFLAPAEGAIVPFHLPVYGAVSAAKRFKLRNIGQGVAQLDAADGKTIDGAVTLDLNPGDKIEITKDGANWQTTI